MTFSRKARIGLALKGKLPPGETLPKEDWPEAAQRLSEMFRRATGQPDANIIIELPANNITIRTMMSEPLVIEGNTFWRRPYSVEFGTPEIEPVIYRNCHFIDDPEPPMQAPEPDPAPPAFRIKWPTRKGLIISALILMTLATAPFWGKPAIHLFTHLPIDEGH